MVRCVSMDMPKHHALALQVGVYAALGVANSMNKYNSGIAFKMAASLATIFIFWDLKWVLALIVVTSCYIVTVQTVIVHLDLCSHLVDVQWFSCRWVFYTVWSPFTWLVGYVDPRKPSNDVLHGESVKEQVLPWPSNAPAVQGKVVPSTMPVWELHCTRPLSALLAKCRMVFPLIVGSLRVDIRHAVCMGASKGAASAVQSQQAMPAW